MKVFSSYYYGPFPFMIFGSVPLMIVLSWGAIVYGAMRTSDHMELAWWLRPIYDGLLAITIDLALDPVAIKLGYWTWNSAFEKPYWFDIPFGNYYGWYMVVFWYSLVARLLFIFTPPAWLGAWRDVLIPGIATVLAMIPFYLSLLVYGFLTMPPPMGLGVFEPTVFAIIMGANLLLVLRVFAEAPHDAPFDWGAFAAPLFFQPFVLVMMFAYGINVLVPALIILVPVVGVFSAICYAWPYLNKIRHWLQIHRKFSVLSPEAIARRGFTLIELLVVIAIIAVLIALFFPPFRRRAKQHGEFNARTI